MLIVIIINIITIKIGIIKIGDDSKRVISMQNIDAIQKRIGEVKIYLNEIWNNSMNMLPKHINTFSVLLTIFIIIKYKKDRKFELILKYLFLILAILAVCIAPMFIFNTGICGRVNVPISEVLGISLVLSFAVSIKYKTKSNIIYGIIILVFLLNAIMILQNTAEHIAANRVDEALGKTIKYAIEKYEKENNAEIKKFAYAFDKNPSQYSEGIKQIGSLTERKIACPWCVQEALEFYTGKKFELVKMPINIFSKFPKEDYLEFSEEQLVFSNDTIFMLIY